MKNLQNLFADNFVVYFKSHIYHFNVVGPTFAQDHTLFQEVYEYLWEQHDIIGELIRQTDQLIKIELPEIADASAISDKKYAMTRDIMFTDLIVDIEQLIKYGETCYEMAGNTGLGGVETALGDYLKGLGKLRWKLIASKGMK